MGCYFVYHGCIEIIDTHSFLMVWCESKSFHTLCFKWRQRRLDQRWISPPSFLCHFLFNIPSAPQRRRLLEQSPTEGALAADLVSVAMEQCVTELGPGKGGRVVEQGRATACVTPHMLPCLDVQISQPIPTSSPGRLSLNTAAGYDASSRPLVMWCHCGSCWGKHSKGGSESKKERVRETGRERWPHQTE